MGSVFGNVIKPVVAASLIFSSSVMSAAPAAAAAVASSSCGGGEAVRAACMVPSVSAGAAVSAQTGVGESSFIIGGLLIPVVGFAAFMALIVAVDAASGDSDGEGSLSRG